MPLLTKVVYAVLLESHMEPAISLSLFYSYFFNFYKILPPNSRNSFSLFNNYYFFYSKLDIQLAVNCNFLTARLRGPPMPEVEKNQN